MARIAGWKNSPIKNCFGKINVARPCREIQYATDSSKRSLESDHFQAILKSATSMFEDELLASNLVFDQKNDLIDESDQSLASSKSTFPVKFPLIDDGLEDVSSEFDGFGGDCDEKYSLGDMTDTILKFRADPEMSSFFKTLAELENIFESHSDDSDTNVVKELAKILTGELAVLENFTYNMVSKIVSVYGITLSIVDF